MWICLCEAVTSSTIREAINRGAGTLQAVGEACGAGTSCGKCKRTILLLLEERDPTVLIERGPITRKERPWKSAPRS